MLPDYGIELSKWIEPSTSVVVGPMWPQMIYKYPSFVDVTGTFYADDGRCYCVTVEADKKSPALRAIGTETPVWVFGKVQPTVHRNDKGDAWRVIKGSLFLSLKEAGEAVQNSPSAKSRRKREDKMRRRAESGRKSDRRYKEIFGTGSARNRLDP